MKKFSVLCLVLIFSMPVFAEKIGCVDMKKVWESSKEIQTEKAQFEAMIKKSQAEIKQKEDELQKLQDKAKKDGPNMTEEAKKALFEEMQTKYAKYQQLAAEHQKKLQDKDIKVQGDFVEKVKKIAAQVAKSKGIDIVLPKENVLYINDTLDLTNEVLKIVNK